MLLHACWIQATSHVNIIEHLWTFSGIEMNFPSSVLAACREAHESTTFYTPWKINPTNHLCRKEHYLPNMIFQTSMIMFHVNLQGCIGDVGSISFVYLPRPSRLISIGSIGTQGNLGTLPEEQAEITHYSEGDVFHGWAGWISFLVMVLYPRSFFNKKKQEIFLVTLVYAELSCFFGR